MIVVGRRRGRPFYSAKHLGRPIDRILVIESWRQGRPAYINRGFLLNARRLETHVLR